MPAGAIVYDPAYRDHETGDHIESTSRIEAIMDRIREDERARRVQILKPLKAAPDQVEANHDIRYIASVRRLAEAGGGWLDLDTYCSSHSYEVALLAVGGVICAVDAVTADVHNVMAIVRPPGHHAVWDKAMGFCIFNNVACAAKYALSDKGIERVLIVDWDVHHGNGTQASFYADSRVLYLSTHQRPFYPGTGDFEEVGSGQGEGFTVNLPLPSGVNDDGFSYAYDRLFVPIAEQFEPELTFVSAGQDIHFADPIGGMLATSKGFRELTERVKSVTPRGQVIACLEGGYNLRALADSTLTVCGSLFDFPTHVEENDVKSGVSQQVIDRVERAISVQSKYWGL